MARVDDFFVTIGGAAAALTGLLFVAVALRPREIRLSPLMLGRARSAFYGFATVLLVALLALAGTGSRLIGLVQLLVVVVVLTQSMPFTLAAWRAGSLNYGRAFVYHAGLAFVACQASCARPGRPPARRGSPRDRCPAAARHRAQQLVAARALAPRGDDAESAE